MMLNFSDLWQEDFKATAMIMTSILILFIIFYAYPSRRCPGMPRLQGPYSESFIFGNAEKTFYSTDISLVHHDWEQKYGPVYQIPTGFRSSHVVLSDPKALSHLFSKDTTKYHNPALVRALSRKLFGSAITGAEGNEHKRLRRALSSPFSVSAIRNLAPVCLDSAYQLKAAWDSDDAAVIDVEKWMDYLTLDVMGKTMLSHDFGTLRGHTSSVMAAIDSVHTIKSSSPFVRFNFFFAPLFYALFKVNLTSNRDQKIAQLAAHLNVLTTDLIRKACKDPEDSDVHKSVLGLLVNPESANSNIHLSLPEVATQINLFFLAALESTAVTLTWSLIELARRPGIQETLRAELTDCLAEGERPTYHQLSKDLKYLNAFMSEILRLHPPEAQKTRVAVEDDVIPLTDPVRTASGAMIRDLFVKKGTVVCIPLGGMNISEKLWGSDAGTFDPGRWLNAEDKKGGRQKVPGYRNLLTFSAGPRLCPGRELAMLVMKAAISVLVSHFAFEFPNGPPTELSLHFARPRVVNEDGTKVPPSLLVRRLTR